MQNKSTILTSIALFTTIATAMLTTGCVQQKGSLPTIHNLIILDRSGSMNEIRQKALDGLNETIKTIKVVVAEHPGQEQRITIVAFSNADRKYTPVVMDKQASEVDTLVLSQYRPNGLTPLWDALGKSLKSLESKVKKDDLALVTIITDGYENDSKTYNRKDIKKMIDRLTERGWTFAYIGANQDSKNVAASIGIANYLNFKADEKNTAEMWRKDIESRKRYYEESRMNPSTKAKTVPSEYFKVEK